MKPQSPSVRERGKMNKTVLLLFFFVFLLLGLPSNLHGREGSSKIPPWVSDVPVPQNEEIYLVVKEVFLNRKDAEKLSSFIQYLMGTTPGDGVDPTEVYEGLPKGKYVVGMLFDSKERAQWWIDFSYRNQKISKGTIQAVKVVGSSLLPYMPSAVRGSQKRLFTEEEALTQVKNLPDVYALSQKKKLKFRFTDYPRNGDLRYEIEVMEDRGSKLDPLMLDFVMVSALDGKITERYSAALGQGNLAKE